MTSGTRPLTVPADPETVESPKHPLYALATFELRNYRRQLERAITFFSTQDPVPPIRDDLQARLEDVDAEQDSRSRASRA
jgi:hypothetical protein